MKFQTKMHEVDAISVERLTKTVNEQNFNSLPNWVKKAFVKDSLFIGYSEVVINDAANIVIAELGDVLILKPQEQIEVMSKKDFFERYEGVFPANDVNIV